MKHKRFDKNLKESRRLQKELEKIPSLEIIDKVKKGFILAHAKYTLDKNFKLIFRDDYKNLCKLREYGNVHFDAYYNLRNDESKEIELFYTIGFTIFGSQRMYRHKYWHEFEMYNFNKSSASLEKLIRHFKTFLENNIIKQSFDNV